MVFVEQNNTSLCNLNRPRSEPVLVAHWLVLARVDLDLLTETPRRRRLALGFLALLLAEDVEHGVELLGLVLVGVQAELVVEDVLVLPVAVGFDVQNLHEGIDLNV